jgi:hypothetical protein
MNEEGVDESNNEMDDDADEIRANKASLVIAPNDKRKSTGTESSINFIELNIELDNSLIDGIIEGISR